MLEKIIRHIQENKRFHIAWLSLLTFIGIILITGIKIGDRVILNGLRIDNSMEVWFRDDDPDWLKYKRFQDQFEGDEIIIVSFRTGDIFKRKILMKIKHLTAEFENMPYISQVTSLTNVHEFRGKGGMLTINELFERIPEEREILEKTRKRIMKNPLYRDNVISGDGKTTAIYIRLEKQPQGINYQRSVTDLVYDICERESENGRYTFHVAGGPALLALEDKASTDDAALEYSLLFIILVLFLYLLHRRIVYVIIPITVIAVANIWIHGIIPACGSSYNMITNIIATLVMVIGIADTIHFISEYNAEINIEIDSKKAAFKACKTIFIPCLFTSLTTAAGFMTMAVSHLQPVAEFGIYAGIAMLLTYVINMVLVTIWLGSVKKGAKEMPGLKDDGIIQRAMRKVSLINRRHVKVNVFIAILVFAVSLTGLAMIEINTHEIKYFKENHPIRVATEFIEENLTGTIPLEIMLTSAPGAFQEPGTLNKIEKLENFLESIDEIQKTFSAVDYVKEINRVIHDEEQEYYKIPDTKNGVAQLMLLTEGEHNELLNYVDFNDFSAARIHSRLNYIDTKQIRLIVDLVERKIAEIFPEDRIKAETTGAIPMYLNAEEYILDSQITGFGLALVVIFIMLTLLVRSLKLGLIAMVPNVIPIFLTFGIMGWLDIYLDMGTVLIASIAIGLAVDDTIHFIARFRHFFDMHKNYDTAIDETLHSVGSPITITSIVLFFGFGVLVVSTFKPVIYFGLLAAITMISALVADLFVLPALIKLFKPFGEEKAE